METSIKTLLMMYIAIITTGCGGMLLDSINYSELTSDETFSELTQNRDPIPSGYGRVFFYRTKNSNRTRMVPGTGLLKNSYIFCRTNNLHITAYREAYTYENVPAGKNAVGVTCDNSMVYSPRSVGGGTQTILVTVQDQAELFIRIDIVDEMVTNIDEIDKRDIVSYPDKINLRDQTDEDETIAIYRIRKEVPILIEEIIAKNEIQNLPEYRASQ